MDIRDEADDDLSPQASKSKVTLVNGMVHVFTHHTTFYHGIE